jgi:hypothetical protein
VKGKRGSAAGEKLAALYRDREFWLTRSDAIALHVLDWIATAIAMWERVERGELKLGAPQREEAGEL